MTAPQFNIVMVAGETSGDTLGAELITRLQAPQTIHFTSVAWAKRMRAAGMECIDHRDLDIVGFIEVIKQFRQINPAFRSLQAHLQDAA